MSTAQLESTVVDAAPKQLLIGGEWRDATGGATLAVEDPSTGEAICEIADATPEDAQAAIDNAAEAQADWAATSPNERGAGQPAASVMVALTLAACTHADGASGITRSGSDGCVSRP